MGGILFFVLLALVLSNRTNGQSSSGRKARQGRGGWYIWIAFIWLIFVIGCVASTHMTSAYFILFLVGMFPLLLPSIASKLTGVFGCYKISYYLGRMAFIYFRADTYGGAMYRSYRALNTIRDADKRQRALCWLQTRYLQYRGPIYSGAMVMVVIVEAQLTKPKDRDYLADQLNLLDGIYTDAVPKCIGIHASKLALPKILHSGDWPKIFHGANQWCTPGNILTELIMAYHDRYVNYSSYSSWFRFTRLQISNFRYPSIKKMLRRIPTGELALPDYPEAQRHLALWRQQRHSNKTTLQRSNQALEDSVADAEKTRWQTRAKELGIRAVDEAWSAILSSVDQQRAQLTGKVEPQNEAEYEEFERQFKGLVYLSRSIENRLRRNSRSCGAQEFLEWWTVLTQLQRFKHDEGRHLQAFVAIHNVMWNWVAELWNNRNQKSLAHFISEVCEPLAKRSGCKELSDMMDNLVNGHHG